jgi:bleomycin hydrolase
MLLNGVNSDADSNADSDADSDAVSEATSEEHQPQQKRSKNNAKTNRRSTIKNNAKAKAAPSQKSKKSEKSKNPKQSKQSKQSKESKPSKRRKVVTVEDSDSVSASDEDSGGPNEHVDESKGIPTELLQLIEQMQHEQHKLNDAKRKQRALHKQEVGKTMAKLFEKKHVKNMHTKRLKTLKKVDSDDETEDTEGSESETESESELEISAKDLAKSRKRKRSTSTSVTQKSLKRDSLSGKSGKSSSPLGKSEKSEESESEKSEPEESDSETSENQDTPPLEIMEVYKGNAIDEAEIEYYEKKYNKDKVFNDTIRNAVSNMPFTYLAVNRDRVQQINFVYTHDISPSLHITNQHDSGRCWIFAGLNMMRPAMMARYGLADFEFSQSYLFFWDKLERANLYLETVMYHKDHEMDDFMRSLIRSKFSDGGSWHYFVNLVNKYGVVPKDVYGESFNSSVSSQMNDVINYKMHEFAIELLKSNMTDVELRERKRKMMAEVYRLLVQFMGKPPMSNKSQSHFTWQYMDIAGQSHEIKNLTPHKFYKLHVPFDVNNYVLMAHDPRSEHKYYETYVTDYATNMMQGELCTYIKCPIERMKYYCAESIKNQEPVWFSCDMGQDFLMFKNIMDPKMFETEKLLHTSFKMSKEDRFLTGVGYANHAMIIVGVDEVKEKVYRKWKVENSWGVMTDDPTDVNGKYLHMTDEWFTEHVYEVIINKQYLTPRDLKLIGENSDNVHCLPYYDIFNGLFKKD